MKTLRKNKKRISGKKHNSKLINKKSTRMRGGATLSLPVNSRLNQFNLSYVGLNKKDDKIDKIFEFEIAKFNKEQLTDINDMVIDIYISDTNLFNPVNADKPKKYFKFIYKKLGNDGIRKIIYVYPKYQEVSRLHPSNDKVNQDIFIVHEFNNQAISVETDPNLEKGLIITPLELSVDTMQLAINTGCLQISQEGDNSYLGFVSNSSISFPSLVSKEKSFYGYQSSRNNAIWTNVYEDDTTFKIDETYTSPDVHVNYQDKSQPRINTDILFQNEPYFIKMKEQIQMVIKQIQIIKNLMKKEKEKPRRLTRPKVNSISLSLKPNTPRSNINLPITNTETLTLIESFKLLNDKLFEIFNEDNKNKAYFESKQKNIKDNLDNKNYDELIKFLNLELERLYNRCIYGKNVKVEDGDEKSYLITENIGWVMQNSLWLEKYLENKANITEATKAVDLNTLIGEEYKCDDLTGLDAKYIIVDEFKNDGEGGDGLEYVICGYPDKNMKEIILSFWQDIEMKVELDKVHEEQTIKFYEWFSKLFNEFVNLESIDALTKTPDKFNDIHRQAEINTINIEKNKANVNEIYKFFYKLIETQIVKYIKDRYNKTIAEPNNIFNLNENDLNFFRTNLIKFNQIWETNIKTYFNDIAQQYLNIIILNIKYIFLVFKKNKNNSLQPAIFNIKELEIKYKPILERINKFIRNEIPIIFDIKQINENKKLSTEYSNIKKIYNNKNTYIPILTDNFISDNEYKLFYTYYSYGNIFSFKTEFVHSLSNLGHKAYKYKNNITLEEIIYSCSLLSNNYKPFWEDVKFNYDTREHIIFILKTNPKLINRTDILFKELNLYYNNNKEKEKIEILSIDSLIFCKILLMYKNSNNHFIYIYVK